MGDVMGKVTIMRGLPGSGKSTYVRTHYPKAAVCSADDFFVGQDKIYRYDPSKIRDAHRWCMKRFLDLVYQQKPEIVVDNTNTMLWEFAGYVQIAEAFGYEVEIVRVIAPVDVAASRNIHGVSQKTVQEMSNRFQQCLPWWKETVVNGF